MTVLCDLLHPAHVHLFRNFIFYLKEHGHQVIVTSRSKEVTNQLLDHYKIPYISLTHPGKGVLGKAVELLRRDAQIFRLHKRYRFSMAFGSSASPAHLSLFTGVQSYHFNTNDDEFMPLLVYQSYPFFTKIIVPNCVRYARWHAKRVPYNSYHQLAFLHPHHFTPDDRVLQQYHLEARKYVVLRLCAHTAYHDHNVEGISPKMFEHIRTLLKGYTVIVSREDLQTQNIAPWDLHHLLAFAKAIISDSASMTAEAAVLGTPALYITNHYQTLGYIQELETKFQLVKTIAPQAERLLCENIEYLLRQPDIETMWRRKRQKLLDEKDDLLRWMISYFEALPCHSQQLLGASPGTRDE